MRYSAGVNIVKCGKHLLEVETADTLMEFTGGCNEIKELTALDEFENDVGDLLFISRSLFPDTVSVVLNQINNIWVIKSFHDFDFSFDQFQSFSIVRRVAAVHDLDGVLIVVLVGGKFDLGADTSSKSSSQIVVSNS